MIDPKRRALFEKEAMEYCPQMPADGNDTEHPANVWIREAFVAGREAAEPEIDNIYALLKEICDEWNEGCDPNCDSYGHEETCKSVNIAQAKKALKQDIERKNEIIQDLTNLVSKNHQEIQKLQALIAVKDDKLNSIIAHSHSWVITRETAGIEQPIHDSYRKLAREALALTPEQAHTSARINSELSAEAYKEIRESTLEEAAKACEIGMYTDPDGSPALYAPGDWPTPESCAAAIRALKRPKP